MWEGGSGLKQVAVVWEGLRVLAGGSSSGVGLDGGSGCKRELRAGVEGWGKGGIWGSESG